MALEMLRLPQCQFCHVDQLTRWNLQAGLFEELLRSSTFGTSLGRQSYQPESRKMTDYQLALAAVEVITTSCSSLSSGWMIMRMATLPPRRNTMPANWTRALRIGNDGLHLDEANVRAEEVHRLDFY